MRQFTWPFQQFFDLSGNPLENGYIYIGEESLNPETNPVAVFWDSDGTIPAAQPLRTSSGYIARNGTPTLIYVEPLNYSVTIRDHNGAVLYVFSKVVAEASSGEWYLDASAYIDVSNSAGQNNTGWANLLVAAAAVTTSPAAGCFVTVPPGTHLFSAPTPLIANLTVQGAGKRTTIFSYSHTGNGMTMTSPINSSTAVTTCVENMQFRNTNASNAGGGYVDICGTFVQVTNCLFYGWKYHVVFDQTELGDILNCAFEATLAASGSISVWLLNGPDFTPGALGGFTNRISVKQCQFNGSHYGVADDGGAAHVIECCNFNGGTNGVRAAGTGPLKIIGCEFESTTASPIAMEYTTLVLGGGVGGNLLELDSNILPSTVSIPAVSVNVGASRQSLVSINNSYGGLGAKVSPVAGMTQLISIGDFLVGGTFADRVTGFDTNNNGGWTPVVKFGGASVGVTYANRNAAYSIWGNMVTFNLAIRLTSKGSSTGDLTITGIPKGPTSGYDQPLGAVTLSNTSGLGESVFGYIQNGTDNIYINDKSINPTTQITNTNIGNSTEIAISGSFYI